MFSGLPCAGQPWAKKQKIDTWLLIHSATAKRGRTISRLLRLVRVVVPELVMSECNARRHTCWARASTYQRPQKGKKAFTRSRCWYSSTTSLSPAQSSPSEVGSRLKSYPNIFLVHYFFFNSRLHFPGRTRTSRLPHSKKN